MNDIWIQATYDVVDELKSTPTHQRWAALRDSIEQDPQVAALIAAFQTTKDAYEDAKQYGDYHPDKATRQVAFQAAKTALFEHPLVSEFKRLEQTIQRDLDAISKQLAQSVSSKIKHPNELGILPRHGR